MENKNYNEIAKILAFVALFLSAIILVISGILPQLVGILSIIKDISLLVAIAIPAYSFAQKLGKIWVIAYWIIIIVFLVGLVIGGAKL